jgi:hypothetical protein
MPRPTSLLSAAAIVAVALAPSPAAAQVNNDIGLSAGGMKRFTTGSEATDPGFGAVVQLQGHVALLPMLRAGLYAAWDISPMPSYGARNFYEGGLHVKLTPPLLSAPWKTYLFLGFGAGYVRQNGYTAPGGPPTGTGPVPQVQYSSTDGAILEIPAGLGLAYQLGSRSAHRHWELFLELGGRFGVGFIGRIYDPYDTATASQPNLRNGQNTIQGAFTGQDSFALMLSAGVSWSD